MDRGAPGSRRESTLHLRALLDNVSDVIVGLDAAGVVRLVSPSCERVLARPAAEFIGRPAQEAVHPEDRAAIGEIQSEALANPGVTLRAEFRCRHRDGSWRAFEATARGIADDAGDLKVVVSARDVTEASRERAALSQRARAAEFTAAINAALAGSEDMRALLERACRTIVEQLGAAAAQIFLLDGGEFETAAAARAAGEPGGTDCFVASDHPIVMQAARERHPVSSAAAPRAPDAPWGPSPGGGVSVDAFPLLAEERVFGVLVIAWREASGGIRSETIASAATGLATAIRGQQIRRALFEQRMLLRYVLDNIPHFVFWKDRDSVYLGCNAIFAKAAGVKDPEAIVGKTDYDLAWKREETESYREWDRYVMQSGRPILHLEETQLRADGKETVLLTSKVPMTDDAGNVIGILGIYTDITERKDRERTMRLLSAAVEHAGEAVVITDRSGVIQYVNPAFTWTTGYTREEAVGARPSVLKSGKHGNDFYRELWETITRGEVWKGLFSNRRKDGALFDEEATISPIRDETGRLCSFVAVKRDVTRELALEVQLRQSQKLEAIGQLAAGIAHEINTPAQYVGDNIRFLQDAFKDVLALRAYVAGALETPPGEAASADALEALRRSSAALEEEGLFEEIPRAIEQSVEGMGRITRIVRAMKEFAHPGEEKSPTDLNRAIESTVTVARNEWKYVADVVTDFDPDLPAVSCVRAEINQAILNIVVNAAQAIAPLVGDGARAKGTIGIATRRDGDSVEIRISDDGVGIPEAIRDRIFDPFFTTKEVGKGTGQGLSIAHAVIVKQHGGTIHVDSEPGRGTTFRILLPLAEVPEGAPAAGA